MDYVGRTLEIYVGNRTHEGKEYNEIREYRAIKGTSAARQATRPNTQKQAPEDDDDLPF